MQKNIFVKIGDFFFKFRNYLFPILLILLFAVEKPKAEYYGSHKLEEVKDYFAIFIVFLGLFVRAAVIGFAYIKRGGLNKQVYADKLVIEGFFGVCRNPLYVGNILIYLGVLIMHGAPEILFFGGAFFLFVYFTIVRAEEFFLRNKFGSDFETYCSQVPRWLPKLSNLKKATEGMKFNFKRVLLKDYTTIANSVISLAVVEYYEEISNHISGSHIKLLGVIFGALAATLIIGALKKKKILVAN